MTTPPANPFAPSTAQPVVPEPPPAILPEQARAVSAVLDWYRSEQRKQVFKLFGPAGTGKTSLAKTVASQIGGQILFAAFSGKAAGVLRQKGCRDADTLHHLIYGAPHKDRKGDLVWVPSPASPLKSADLVIIDEASTVDANLGRDLEAFDKPILVLGDRCQLPPITGPGYFMNGPADVELTTVLRQREESPIIRLASQARAGKKLALCQYGTSSVIKSIDLRIETVLKADQVLVARNETRQRFNERIRELLGRPANLPVPGDKLVCLRNNPANGLFNGDICIVESVTELTDKFVTLVVVPEGILGRQVEIRVRREFFVRDGSAIPDAERRREKNQFTFGNALTVHKAQGSEWRSVVLFDEPDVFPEQRSQWLYTGITRASQSIVVVR
jgi:exodeoxyribonuclease-5